MAQTSKDLVAAANAVVERIDPERARALVEREGGLIVDVRDAPEVAASGRAEGAHHVSRGMIEFRADPESPYHDPAFAKDRPVIFYCASGGRAALAGKALKDMGYERVYSVGGFKDWVEAGGAVEPAEGEG